MPVWKDAETGKMYNQSRAIVRYLSSKHGYSGENAEDVYNIDWVMEQSQDYQNTQTVYIVFSPGPLDEEKLKPYKEALVKYLATIDTKLAETGWKYVAGDKISHADFAVFYTTFVQCANTAVKDEEHAKVGREVLAGLPALTKWHEMMMGECEKYVKEAPQAWL